MLDAYLQSDALRGAERIARLNAAGFSLRDDVDRARLVRCTWDNDLRALRVIESLEKHPRSRDSNMLVTWHHVSLSVRSRRLPTWDELAEIKDLFVGNNAEAYVVLPPTEVYINDAPVLHVWCCTSMLKGVLPDFRLKDPIGRVSI